MFKSLSQARIVHKETDVGTCFASQNEESLVRGTKGKYRNAYSCPIFYDHASLHNERYIATFWL
jgi:hypothetical protein